MKIYNSLTRSKQEFVPIKDKHVGMYTCGPTIYSYVTIGNWRTYVLGDILVRTLKYLGYDVNYIMNITDVGHLTGDNLGDADTGDDRLEKAAQKEGKTAWDIAKFYTKDFLHGLDSLNLIKPKLTKATDHIQEQIALVEKIEQAGFAYKISDGIYFDVDKYEATGHQYGQLSNLDKIKEGARVEENKEKHGPRDFALWKFSYPNGRNFDPQQDDPQTRRHMEWDSPWGLGFPGWHIECSAMSMKYLGDQFDIHVGGEDLRSTHHPNEIAQSECATNKSPFVKYWVHGAFLLVDGGRMGKSLGNAYNLIDIKDRKIDPLALRYFYFTGHYRKQLNFTWEALEGAQTALNKLKDFMSSFTNQLRAGTRPAPTDQNLGSDVGEPLVVTRVEGQRTRLSPEKLTKITTWQDKFRSSLEDDLNMPQAIAIVWEMLKDNIPEYDKVDLLLEWDQVLGLRLAEVSSSDDVVIPEQVKKLAEQRDKAREQKKWVEADEIRNQIEKLGYTVEDTASGTQIHQL